MNFLRCSGINYVDCDSQKQFSQMRVTKIEICDEETVDFEGRKQFSKSVGIRFLEKCGEKHVDFERQKQFSRSPR